VGQTQDKIVKEGTEIQGRLSNLSGRIVWEPTLYIAQQNSEGSSFLLFTPLVSIRISRQGFPVSRNVPVVTGNSNFPLNNFIRKSRMASQCTFFFSLQRL